MRSPLVSLRTALAAYLADQALARVGRWRGDADAEPPAAVLEGHAWLEGPEATQALDEARSLGLAPAEELAALEAHRVALRREGAVVPAHRALDALGPDVLTRAGEVAGEVCEARARAAEVAPPVPHPDAGPPLSNLVDHATALLAATDEAAREAAAQWHERPEAGRPPTFDDLVAARRAGALDGMFPSRDRWRRVAADLRGFAFEPVLSARVRTEPDHGEATWRARVAAVDVPRDVRVAGVRSARGLRAELAAADGLGRALGLCLVSPGLPVELRHPVVGSVGRTLGTLLVQVLAERNLLERLRGLGSRDAERVARTAAAGFLLETRLAAAAVVLEGTAGTSLAARRDAAPDIFRRALAVEIPAPVAILIGATEPTIAARYRSRVAGLAAWDALRARYDEDWVRNPRAEEPLRAGAHRGGWLAAEDWVAEELGGEPGADLRRLAELFPC